jgi:hypothetical protein
MHGAGQGEQHLEDTSGPKTQTCPGEHWLSELQLIAVHVAVSIHTGSLPGAPQPPPPPARWHSPWPHVPHAAQPPLMHGGLVVVVVVEVVEVVVVVVLVVVVVVVGSSTSFSTGVQRRPGVLTFTVSVPN